MASEWTFAKVDGKTAITVNGLTWRGSHFFSGPDNADLDSRGVLGLTTFDQDGFNIVAKVVPDDISAWRHDIDGHYIGITVDAYKAGIELGNALLWAIDPQYPDAYLSDLARDLADDAVAEARTNLKILREED